MTVIAILQFSPVPAHFCCGWVKSHICWACRSFLIIVAGKWGEIWRVSILYQVFPNRHLWILAIQNSLFSKLNLVKRKVMFLNHVRSLALKLPSLSSYHIQERSIRVTENLIEITAFVYSSLSILVLTNVVNIYIKYE